MKTQPTFRQHYFQSFDSWLLALVLVISFPLAPSVMAQCPTIQWADEFSGSSLDQNKWSYQIGDGCAEGICGWGNNELQTYQQGNVTLSNGQLHITAKKERVKSKNYTSGRIRTINKGDWTYGRYEALISLPAGQGLWPAFWMLPTDNVYGGWPQSGEIDIMEFVGANPSEVLGYIHYGDPFPNNQNQGNKFVGDSPFPGSFHEFAIEWEPGVIRWFVDGILFSTKTAQDIAPANWPFDQRFHIIMNIAVGGNLGGPVNDAIFPTTMDVDYVRVYNGFKPYISGKRTVANQAAGITYSIGNVAGNTNVSWSVPAGATIVSGQGTPNVTVNWGNTGGTLSGQFNTSCGTQTRSMKVTVEPPYIKDFVFVNFDQAANATFASSTGTLTQVANPAANAINSSANSGKYDRNAAEQYDVLVYNTNAITDASKYVIKDNKFSMDVYTAAPIGTEIFIQLETSTATPTNYPTGRHSRYVGKVTKNNQWERITFDLLDRPDPAAPNAGVTKMILLFASNTFTGNTYYFDNFDSYKVDTGGGTNQPPTVAISSPANGATFSNLNPITVSANAADTDGTIAQVQFFANGQSLGTDNSAPYAANYTPSGNGTVVFTATATDNNGASTTSSPVSVTITTGGSGGSMTNTISLTTVATGPRLKGVAEITVTSSGSPVSAATVAVTWSGNHSGSASGLTDAAGKVIFETPPIKGATTFTVTVNNVSKSGYTWDSANSQLSATSGSGARFISEALSVRGSDDWNIVAYPNPAASELSFKQSVEKELSIVIYSVTGVVVLQKEVNSKEFMIDIRSLSNGVYYYKIRQGEQVASGRIVKQ